MKDNYAQFSRAKPFRAASVIAFITLFVLIAAVAMPPAQAQTYNESVLYSFTGGADGSAPQAKLYRDAAGNLYGTMSKGGDLNCSAPYGCGSIFRLDPCGQFTTLYSFEGAPDGAAPLAGLVADPAGNLYGTTSAGGTYNLGTVFEFNPASGALIKLHSFAGGGSDGADPVASVMRDAAGNLYGTTYAGGKPNLGTVYKLDASGLETVLYSFPRGLGHGSQPMGALIEDERGNLYGTTPNGGSIDEATIAGTVFRMSPTGKMAMLWYFGYDTGFYPSGALVRDTKGNLYGTTAPGSDGWYDNNGVVFKLHARTGEEMVLHTFGVYEGGNPSAELVLDPAGNLYGTTAWGGTSGMGTVFMIDTARQFITLYSFSGPDGSGPSVTGGLIADPGGNLYGVTGSGGAHGNGVIFKLTRTD